VSVWVDTVPDNAVADTFGATVFWMIGMVSSVLHQLLLSSTITVHVPGTVTAVDVLAPRITLGVTTPVKVGARKVYEQVAGGVCVEIGLMMLIVVWFSGVQPTEKFVGLETLKVGKADSEVTVTCLTVLHPFTRLVHTTVYIPGGTFPDRMLSELFDVAIGTPPGSGLSGLYQSCCMLAVGVKIVEVKVTGLPELQVITCEIGVTVVVGATVLMPITTVLCAWQPVARSTPVTISVLAWVMATVGVLAVNDGLDQL
jgi:hypothetical protein